LQGEEVDILLLNAILNQPNGNLSVSIGISNYPDDASTEIDLIDHADAALYAAKRAGRNCVCSYSIPNR